MQPEKKSGKRRIHWLVQQAPLAAWWIGLSVGLGLLSGLLLIAQAWLVSRILHSAALAESNGRAPGTSFVAIAGIVGVRAAIAWGKEAAGFEAGAKIRRQIRDAVLDHIHRLGPGYVAGEKTGSLSSTLMEQIEGLHGFFAHYLPQLALAVMLPIAFAAAVFPLSWAACGLLMVAAPLIPMFMILVGMGAESISQRHFQALSHLSGYFLDILQGLPTLKLFHRSRPEARAIAAASGEYRRRTMSVLKIAFLSSAVLEFFSAVSIALVAVYLGLNYLGYYDFGTWEQPLTLSGGFFILLLAPEFFMPLRDLGTHYHARARAIGAAGEILEILSVPVPCKSAPKKHLTAGRRIDLCFENVHLSYDSGRRPALNGVSFSAKHGEKIALVGASGAGKTSILHLLLKFASPDRGQILANSVPLDRLETDNWRRHLSWIGQDPVLFHGTLSDNIRMGMIDTPVDKIRRAAAAAGVMEFSEKLPHGLETLVGERGYGLSRGQAQRVALARCFLKNAPILLLDEPTAGLDVESERWVIAAMDELFADRTVVMLTHRLRHMEHADRVLVIAGGKIIEQGKYARLISEGGQFRRMVPEHLRRGRDG